MTEKNLVIVESPAKAKTIEKYLGKDFKVVSSMGHVRDLPKDDKAIDIKNGFKPKYEITPDKKELVKKLKELSGKVETVWLATDADREGEAISWHLATALGLDLKSTKRIVFREITKKAINEAITHPRSIDLNLVNAQQARRILDRLVGFELSPVLWKKIKTGLSAGRVQSAAVRLVVEREREIDQFTSKSSYKVTARFDLGNGKILKADLPKNFESKDDAYKFLENCINAIFKLINIEKKLEKQNPSPPFTTSTLQQEASRKLSFSVSQTMLVAQKLYEAGYITYMRTDSTNLSQEALGKAADQINTAYGPEYVHTRNYDTKSENAQEAHEAIRPTDFSVSDIPGGSNEKRLYSLIWKRAIASQMESADIEKTIVTISVSTQPKYNFIATANVIKFDGFLKVYIESKDEDEEDSEENGIMPSLELNKILDMLDITAVQKFSTPAPRYTEASLVKKLEELGIGRPSTYAPTISTIQKRDYVIKESRQPKTREITELILKNGIIKENLKSQNFGSEKNKLFPTNTAMVVNDFLIQNFTDVIDFSFTATVEKEFDEIANGAKEWHNVINEFYTEFHSNVEKATVKPKTTMDVTRDLGIDPKTGLKVYAKLGRYGAYIQIGENDSTDKPKFASLKKNQFLEKINLEEALELFRLPREVGIYLDIPITVAIGRFGPFLGYNKKFYSLSKTDDPYTIELDRAIQIILDKNKADIEKNIKSFDSNPEVKILNGRWGPYISIGKNNYKIPKGTDPKSLSLEDCMKIAEQQSDSTGTSKRRIGTIASKSTARSAPVKK